MNIVQLRVSIVHVTGKGQSKAASLLESATNIAVGAVLAYLTQELVFRFYGLTVSPATNLQILGIFTAVSLARSFVLRRIFNFFTTRNERYY